MQIQEVIAKIKDYHKGILDGQPIQAKTTRDQILYGNPTQECTGIITTCWATVAVIKQAIAKGANLIIVHEALFWNHGDHTDWLAKQQNKTFLAKKQLLDEHNIVVWRDHDYIHSGIPLQNGKYIDGIFYGLPNKLGWVDYIDNDNPLQFKIEKTTVKKLARHLITTLNLHGAKIIGKLDQPVENVRIPFHILGDAKEVITEGDTKDVHCFLAMEVVDFTLAEYVRDSSMFDMDRAIVSVGHFNLEEPGMEYMLTYLPDILGPEISCTYIQSGDMYEYLTK